MAKGAPKGNQYAKGNPGGGRPSAYKERQDAEWHELVWKSVQDVSELENKIATKKYAGRDIAALRLLKGDKYLIGKFMDKLVPNKLDITSDGKALPQPILSTVIDHAVSSNDSDKEDHGSQKENTGSGGGNISVEDDLDSLVPNPQGSK